MEEFKPVVFKLGDRRFGIDISKIQGIEKEQHIVPVPNTEDYIIGIMNLRGDVIPVYSLKKKFNIEAANSQPQYIITWIKNNTIAWRLMALMKYRRWRSPCSIMFRLLSEAVTPAIWTGL